MSLLEESYFEGGTMFLYMHLLYACYIYATCMLHACYMHTYYCLNVMINNCDGS